jgi:hypothetical protein
LLGVGLANQGLMHSRNTDQLVVGQAEWKEADIPDGTEVDGLTLGNRKHVGQGMPRMY